MPIDTSLANHDIAATSIAMRQGRVTCERVIAECLEAIAQAEPALGAFTFVASDQALAEARAVDEGRASRRTANPMTGIPIAVKEVIAVEDMPTTAGTKMEIADLAPPQGAFIKRLRDIGAIVVGKTVSTEFALSYHNLTLPGPKNPCFTTAAYTPGGSSNGSAVAVASGLCPVAIGTDTGGSIRVPAAFCGITGFKPTTEFWPREGMFPLSRELDTIGVLTRTPADLIATLEGIGGGIVPEIALSSIHFGLTETPFYDNLDPAISQAIGEAIKRLCKAGASVAKIVMPSITPLDSFASIVNSAALVRYLGRERVERNIDLVDPVTRLRFQAGLEASIIDIQSLLETRRFLSSRINSNLAHIDALITPTTPNLPVEIARFADAESIAEWQALTSQNVRFANLFNLVAISIPLPGPVPIGLQLIASAGNELKLAGLAQVVGQALEVPG